MGLTEKFNTIKTRKVLAAIFSQVSGLMLGIGLFAYFGDGNSLHPLLTDMSVVWALLLVGGFYRCGDAIFLLFQAWKKLRKKVS